MSWKTNVCGVSAAVVAIGNALIATFDGVDTTNPDWPVVIATIVAAVGLLFARDNDKSSEDVGAK